MRTPASNRGGLATIGLFLGLALFLTACNPVYLGAALDQQQQDPETTPWWCDSTGGDHGGHVMDPDPYEGVVKGELSWDDCLTNSAWFDMARDYVQQWPTEGEAEAAGFHQIVPYAQGMGTHHARIGQMDGEFAPGEPQFLMYDGNGPDARLTGMAWWVQSADGPPEGFKGDNDWWHQHRDVCLSQSLTWLGQGFTQEECQARNGVYLPNDDMWMVHAWVLPDWEIQFDVFENHHPCLPWSGPITDRSDPCWTEAVEGGDG